jgi:hypothetical protein
MFPFWLGGAASPWTLANDAIFRWSSFPRNNRQFFPHFDGATAAEVELMNQFAAPPARNLSGAIAMNSINKWLGCVLCFC